MRYLALLVGLLTLSTAGTVSAQSGWQARADLLTSGAAASIIAFQVCEGDSRPAGEKAHSRLAQLAQSLAAGGGADLREVQHYLVDSTNLKVRAMWQANQSRSCAQMFNVRRIATATGFDVP